MNNNTSEKAFSVPQAEKVGAKLLNSGLRLRLHVGGFSMYPFIKDGDLALVENCSINDLTPGDVVVFKRPDKWIAHRLIRISHQNGESSLLTKGDSCLRYDPPVSKKIFAGRIVSVQRNGKRIVLKERAFFNKALLANPKATGILILLFLKLVRLVNKFTAIFNKH